MSQPATLVPANVFAALPPRLRDELLDAFQNIVEHYAEGRWEPSELNGGKLCEVVYSIVRGIADGELPSSASKPSNMVDSCRKLEAVTTAKRSVRIQIPRLLMALYEVRNNRNVG